MASPRTFDERKSCEPNQVVITTKKNEEEKKRKERCHIALELAGIS